MRSKKITKSVRLTQLEWAYALSLGRDSVSYGLGTAIAYHMKREAPEFSIPADPLAMAVPMRPRVPAKPEIF